MIKSTGSEARLPEYKCTFWYHTGFSSVPPNVHLEPVNVTLFGNRVFADVIKVR